MKRIYYRARRALPPAARAPLNPAPLLPHDCSPPPPRQDAFRRLPFPRTPRLDVAGKKRGPRFLFCRPLGLALASIFIWTLATSRLGRFPPKRSGRSVLCRVKLKRRRGGGKDCFPFILTVHLQLELGDESPSRRCSRSFLQEA